VGEPFATADLPDELDLQVVSATLLNARLREGDDFTQLARSVKAAYKLLGAVPPTLAPATRSHAA
jgi:hypothetical protein